MKTFDEKRDVSMDPIASDHRIEDLNPTDEAMMFDNGPEAPAERHSNEAVKGAAWLLGIVGIFAVAVLFAWLIGTHDNPMSSRSESRASAALTPSAQPLAPQQGSQLVAVFVQPAASQSAASGSTSAGNPAAKSSSTAASAKGSTSSAAVSSSDADRIEREAREVIHGDFGDNPGRKAKLGADYAAVQARVNQLLM